MRTLHEERDRAKTERIKKSMEKNGWQGVPLVRDGEQLLTGTHRYLAAQELGWGDSDIPMIDLETLYRDAGLDMAELHSEHDSPTIDEWCEWVGFLSELPESVRDNYGIDVE